jgi:hypothetical protein
MGTGNRDLYSSFLKVRGTWESSGVPNIELAMMQLIHSRKALETDPIAHAGTTGIPNTLEEVFTIKGSNIFNQDKIAEAHQAKDHGEEALDGRALRVYHVA